MQDVPTNIVNHLYATFECTHCLANCSVSLGQLWGEADVECAECGTELDFEADLELAGGIEGLAGAYDGLVDMLARRHIPIHFHS
jgi:transcription elongation factor Elf1